METATAWIANFCQHTFLLMSLTTNAAVEALVPLGIAARSILLEDFDSSTTPRPDWLLALRENAWVLVVLLLWLSGCYALDSDSGPFPWMFVKRRVLGASLQERGLRNDLSMIRKWVTGHTLSKKRMSNWWFRDLPGGENGEAAAFSRVAECQEIKNMFREKFSEGTYAVESIPFMNEVFVSGPPKPAKNITTDVLFTTRHNDGPFALLPFCSTFRCVLGLDSSASFTTTFTSVPGMSKTCRTGEIVCFDFNREVHYIIPNANAKQEQASLAPENGGDGHRVGLKLHFIVYPRILWPLGKLAAVLTMQYHMRIRRLFVFTSSPSSVSCRILVILIVKVFNLYRAANETGLHNLLYAAALFLAGRLIHPVVFLVGTSFVHYPRYITTYYHRSSDIDFGAFKSTFLFFQALALSHVGYRYVSVLLAAGLNNTAATVSLCLVLAGFTLSILATKAVGMNGTVLGPELGICKMKWTTTFPYNYISHAMIVGQLAAFAGVHLLPEFRAAWPWLMPAHCTFYLMVKMQQHFDLHGKRS